MTHIPSGWGVTYAVRREGSGPIPLTQRVLVGTLSFRLGVYPTLGEPSVYVRGLKFTTRSKRPLSPSARSMCFRRHTSMRRQARGRAYRRRMLS